MKGKRRNGKGKEYNGDVFEYEIVEYLNGKKKVIEKNNIFSKIFDQSQQQLKNNN